MTKGHIVLTTGGSGGHIYPALVVAEILLAEGYKVSFIGQAKGMEANIVPEAGISFYGVKAGKWRRGELNLSLITEPIKTFLGLFDAIKHLKHLKPIKVIGFGGFASFPALAAATFLHIPIILHEANAFPGKVTRWFARRAKLVLVSASEAEAYLSQAKNLAYVDLPIREAKVNKLEARKQLGLPTEGLVTLVMGGSQGSLTLNDRVPKAFEGMKKASNHFVLHSSGKQWYEVIKKEVAHLKNYYLQGYLDTTLAWAAADLAITRAGMSTITEAAFYGVPLIMIPLPTAAENHQYHNAKVVENSGAGRVIEESQLKENISLLRNLWQELLEPNNNKLASEAALKRYSAGAAKNFVKVLENFMTSSISTKEER